MGIRSIYTCSTSILEYELRRIPSHREQRSGVARGTTLQRIRSTAQPTCQTDSFGEQFGTSRLSIAPTRESRSRLSSNQVASVMHRSYPADTASVSQHRPSTKPCITGNDGENSIIASSRSRCHASFVPLSPTRKKSNSENLQTELGPKGVYPDYYCIILNTNIGLNRQTQYSIF